MMRIGRVLQIRTSLDKTHPVLHLSGELTAEAEEALQRSYSDIPVDRRTRVILDFQETKYINSSGIAILIALITKSNEVQHNVEFAGLSAHFQRVLDIVGLTEFVKVFPNVDEALKSA